MFPYRISHIVAASLLLAGLTAALGCRIETAPSRIDRKELHLEKLADAPLPILPQPEYDQAEHVMQSCGQPLTDIVTPVYSKYYNGPVRRLEYVGNRRVTLDFIPSRPRAQLAHEEAPLPHNGYNGYTQLPPNATWRFQAGRMEQEVMITAHRVAFYLPCAGEALNHEF